MNCFVKQVLCLGAAVLGILIPSSNYAKHGHTKTTPTIPSSFKECHHTSKHRTTFKHSMQLYLADAYGIEVPGSEFWITIDVIKEKLTM